jgi:hypothetical protein
MGAARLRLQVARRGGAPDLALVGKFSTMGALCAALATARVTARCAIALSMERCLVALSTASGEGLSGREPQSVFITVLHREAIE